MTDHNLILPKSDVMRASANEIAQITKPLRRFGISMVCYTKVYNDGTLIDMCDNSDLIDYIYYKTDIYKHYTPDANPQAFEDGFVLCSSLEDEKCSQILQSVKENLALDNTMALIKKYDTYCEIWSFASNSNNNKIINFYLNNLDILESFTYVFKEQAANIIKKYEIDKIIRPKSNSLVQGSNINMDMLKQEYSKDVRINKICLGEKYNNSTLTTQETQCLKYFLQGKSHEEIGIIVGTSKRTIEKHLNNIKMKFNCFKMTNLVRKALELNLHVLFEETL